MKKLVLAGLIGSVLMTATAFAAERPAVPAKGTEGPDIRLTQTDHAVQPVKGVEGPEVR